MRSLRALVVLLLTAAVVGLPTVAAAKPDRLELSPDGVTWSPTLTRPLFQDGPVLVPLDAAVRSFHVRNASKVPARVSVEVLAPSGGSELQRYLQVSTSIGSVSATDELRRIGRDRCRVIVTGPTMRPGSSERVDVGLRLPDLPGKVAQAQSVDLGLSVRLTQVNPAGVVTICGVQAEAAPLDLCEAVQVRVVGVGTRRCDAVFPAGPAGSGAAASGPAASGPVAQGTAGSTALPATRRPGRPGRDRARRPRAHGGGRGAAPRAPPPVSAGQLTRDVASAGRGRLVRAAARVRRPARCPLRGRRPSPATTARRRRPAPRPGPAPGT